MIIHQDWMYANVRKKNQSFGLRHVITTKRAHHWLFVCLRDRVFVVFRAFPLAFWSASFVGNRDRLHSRQTVSVVWRVVACLKTLACDRVSHWATRHGRQRHSSSTHPAAAAAATRYPRHTEAHTAAHSHAVAAVASCQEDSRDAVAEVAHACHSHELATTAAALLHTGCDVDEREEDVHEEVGVHEEDGHEEGVHGRAGMSARAVAVLHTHDAASDGTGCSGALHVAHNA
mmetsp:Transcript_25384/g.41367  ORF Transcript_25384/g.41367 Transcript_25384/m.41367 type:complete len:231 (+) Transcript_25384:135-827(+)